MSRAFRLGITGKIGSGKSTLSQILRNDGITVIDADTLAKDLMNSDESLQKEIEAVLGAEAYTENQINRTFIAQKIFTDAELKSKLESIVHPATLREIMREFDAAPPGSIIALESAILFQTGLEEIFDALVLVESSDENAIKRLISERKFSEADAKQRLGEQSYQKEWNDDADFVIENNGDQAGFVKRAEELVKIIKIISVQNLPTESLRSIIE
ncbi:MAG: dephospho-CoA kinase [bacterium]